MTFFTTADLGDHATDVLKACDEEGEVAIRLQDGRRYLLKKVKETSLSTSVPDIFQRFSQMGMKESISSDQVRVADAIIAGENR